MKLIIISILSIFILLSASPQATSYWVWKVNQSAIAETLCVKKEIKGNTCQGKCHLKIQLDASDDQKAPKAPVEKEINNMLLYCSAINNTSLRSSTKILQNIIPNSYTTYIDRIVTGRMLRPPQFLA